MVDIIPTKGRIVWYVLSAQDADTIKRRRQHTAEIGNEAREGSVYPAMIVETWGDKPDSAVNLKVELDGYDVHWATSRKIGEGPGTYHWMPYQKGQAAKTEAAKLAAAGHK